MKKSKGNGIFLSTPLEEKRGFLFKREDLNPSGSVKDRAILKQVLTYLAEGKKRFAISTSGNAGISLSFWAKKFKFEAVVFVSPRIAPSKLEELKRLKAKLVVTPKPISGGWRFCCKNGFVWLRQSADPAALEGFADIGKELKKQLATKRCDCLFVPLSSGTTFLGIHRGLSPFLRKKIRFFFVQSGFYAPLASFFDQDFYPEGENLTDALVAKIIPQKKRIIQITQKTLGKGVVVQNDQIRKANRYLESLGVKASSEAGAVLAAYWKCLRKRIISSSTRPLFLITSKKR